MTKKKKGILIISSIIVLIAIGISAFYLLKKPTLESVLDSKTSSWEATVTDIKVNGSLKKELEQELNLDIDEIIDTIEGYKNTIDFYSYAKGAVSISVGKEKYAIPFAFKARDNKAELNVSNLPLLFGSNPTFSLTASTISTEKIEGDLEVTFDSLTKEQANISISIVLTNKSRPKEPTKDSELKSFLTQDGGKWNFSAYLMADKVENMAPKEASIEFKKDGTGNMEKFLSDNTSQPFTYKIEKNTINITLKDDETGKNVNFSIFVDSAEDNKIDAGFKLLLNKDDAETLSSGNSEELEARQDATRITLTK
ncbi:hypothetical protein IGI39_001842 [Enterococcus sp. AZ135]|uniref:hypothetical protein n=1 Tax=unclassified Enterococcus TaxID=2608891 RepID=UPI003F20B3AA